VRPDGALVSPRGFDQDASLCKRVDDLAGKQFIVQRSVEAFAVAILPWRSGCDLERLHADLRQLLLHRRGDKLRAIVGPDVRGRPRVTNSSASAASASSLLSSRATAGAMYSRLALSMIERIRHFATIMGAALDKVVGPRRARMLGPKPDCTVRRSTRAARASAAFAAP
jgi:hypothetical protein